MEADGNLLDLLPTQAHHFDIGHLGRCSVRGTVLLNILLVINEIMRD